VSYCHRNQIQFKKEIAQLVKEETSCWRKTKEALKNGDKFEEQNNVVFVSHDMVLTMADGKICNTIISTSSDQVCYVCGAAPKQMKRTDEIVTKRCWCNNLQIWAVYTSHVD
jgi:hypothetical protein